MIFIFLSCREKAHDNKEFRREISKLCHVVKRPMITKNSVVKFQNLVMNHKLQPIKSNPE